MSPACTINVFDHLRCGRCDMTRLLSARCLLWLGSAVLVSLYVSSLWAAEPAKSYKFGEYNPADETVEMFAAIEKGDIAVKVVPKDSTLCSIRIENKTDRPLNVRLPEAFAAMPVLAQRAGISSRGAKLPQMVLAAKVSAGA